MNFKKFLAVLLCVVLTLSTVSVLAANTIELPTEYCVAEEITGDGLNVMAVPVYDYNGEASPIELDIAMHFATSETKAEAMTKPYYSYVADFELTFDHDVTALLAGKHKLFTGYIGNDYWLAINAENETEIGGFSANLDGVDFKANEPVSIMSFIDENFTYKDVITLLDGEFDCGVKFAYDAPEYVEAKLELVMYTTNEVTVSDECDYSISIEGVNHYYTVNRDDRHVIVGKEFVYDDASHDFSKDATDAEKAEALNGDASSIDTKVEAIGAIDLVETLEPEAKEAITPDTIKTIYESFNEAPITVAEDVYAAYSIQGGVTVDVEAAEIVDPMLEGSELVLEVTATDDVTGDLVETLDFPALVAIPVDNAANVKKVLHLHNGVLESLEFTPKTEGATTIFVQMSKFSQIAIIEDAALVYNITIPAVSGGTVTSNVTEAVAGEKIKLTASPAADCEFVSLSVTDSTGAEITVANNEFTMPADDVTVNAVFKAKQTYRPSSSQTTGGGSSVTTYTVKFDTNGGSEIKDVKVEKNKTVKEPEAPEKENNIFIGWFADKDLTEEFDFDTKITKATTIYAGWVEKVPANQIILRIDSKAADVFGERKGMDVAPKIVNQRTMLPTRFVAESLGANVEWDEETETVTITKGETVIEIFIGKSYAMVDGKEVDLDAPAFIENDRTYTPIRFISEKLGAHVDWDGETKTVTITKIK